jgi:integrase
VLDVERHARVRALELRELVRQGIDPNEARDAALVQAKAAKQASQVQRERDAATLEAEAQRLHQQLADAGRFKTKKAEREWLAKLEGNIPAEIWTKPIADITEQELSDFMRPLWAAKHPTAKKVRQRLDAIFHLARHHTDGRNVAATIRRDLKIVKSKHREVPHRALPPADMPAFVELLRQRSGTSARALEFLILTASRTNEILRAEWADIDLQAGRWLIPAEKMKGEEGGQEDHLVLLSPQAIAVLESVRGLDRRIVFPSEMRPHAPMSNMAMLNLVERIGYKERMTPHGCRGTFSKWANGQQKWSEDVIEACLAHKEADRVRAAYLQGVNLDTFRADCLRAWANYVAPMRKAGRRLRRAA